MQLNPSDADVHFDIYSGIAQIFLR